MRKFCHSSTMAQPITTRGGAKNEALTPMDTRLSPTPMNNPSGYGRRARSHDQAKTRPKRPVNLFRELLDPEGHTSTLCQSRTQLTLNSPSSARLTQSECLRSRSEESTISALTPTPKNTHKKTVDGSSVRAFPTRCTSRSQRREAEGRARGVERVTSASANTVSEIDNRTEENMCEICVFSRRRQKCQQR